METFSEYIKEWRKHYKELDDVCKKLEKEGLSPEIFLMDNYSEILKDLRGIYGKTETRN